MYSPLNTLKERAIDFLKLASSGNVREAYERYVSEDFIHHNPFFKGDRLSLLTAMEESSKQNPNKAFEVQRALQEGDFVAVHSRVQQKSEIAVVHMFRFQDDLIVELWDIGMVLPNECINENGAF
jgi:predicted SnoaL-like aldol condensation-catalyzing enzyme